MTQGRRFGLDVLARSPMTLDDVDPTDKEEQRALTPAPLTPPQVVHRITW